MHIPVNHNLRPLYRVIAVLTGLYLLVFGVLGFFEARGTGLFEREFHRVLGARTNLGFALLAALLGALVVVATLVGRNIDRTVNIGVGIALWVIGTAMMALMQTDGNFLNFSVATVILTYIAGTVLVTAGLYSKVGEVETAAAEEEFRHATR